MKTFIIENNLLPAPAGTTTASEGNTPLQEGFPVWSFLPDSALCNAGKPFFIPEDAGRMMAYISPVVRISRLGKSIASRFARRYYSEAAPAIHFRDIDMRERLLSLRLPSDMSQAFDRAMIIGEFTNASALSDNCRLSLFKNGEEEDRWETSFLLTPIDSLFPAISKSNTLKTGDYLVPALSKGVEINIGDCLELKMQDNTLLTILIK